MAEILILVGASIFTLLGSAHLFYTFFSNKFEAYDPAVTEAMKGATPVLTKETTVWDAWVGFNASHSYGAILVGAFYIPLVLFYGEIVRGCLWFSNLPVLIGIAYLFLAKRYWFRIPFYGILLATLCFLSASILIHL